MDGTHLNHLHFAAYIVRILKDAQELQQMLEQHQRVLKRICMRINIKKAKLMSSREQYLEIDSEVVK